MPRYDYHCPTNGRTVEVGHRMDEALATWGEVCDRGELDPGSTPRESPVEKVLSACSIGTAGAAPGPAGGPPAGGHAPCGVPGCCRPFG